MRVLLLLTVAISAIIPAAAAAQASDDTEANGRDLESSSGERPPEQREGGITDIIVTAQRRSERLQDVPLSVSAISGEGLADVGIVNTQDLQIVTPGLVMPNVRNTTTPYLRGVGSQSGTAGSEGAVAVYVDGVYLPSAVSTVFSLNNIERIEVLKGPQGTLFGRNATGGLIQVVTRDPSYTPEMRASVGYANYDTVTGSLYATGGLAEGVSADIALYGTHQGEGWGTNFQGQEIGFKREAMVRTKFRFELGETTTAIISADYTRSRNDLGNSRVITTGSVAHGGFVRLSSDYDSLTGQPALMRDSETYGTSLVLRHEIDDNIELTSTTAYRDLSVFSLTDTDATPPQKADFVFEEVGEAFQQELLANAEFGKLSLTGGLFFFHNNAGWDPVRFNFLPGSPGNADRFTRVKTKSYAAFLQGTYEIAPSTRVTAGIRYTIDDASVNGVYVASPGNPNPVGTVLFDTDNLPESQTNRTFKAPTWRLAVDHRLAPDVLLYASYNRGFKSGTFNATAPDSPALNPEKLDAYEVGLKTDILDHTVRFNLAGFYYDYGNIQLQMVTGTGTESFNAPSGELKGLDVELAWVPRLEQGDLQFSVNAAYLDANYKEFPNAPIGVPNDTTVPPFGGNTVISGDATGNRMIKAPEFTLNATASYSTPVSETLEVGANATWQHNSGFFWEVDNRLRQPAYDVTNAQLFVGDRDDAWRVRFWARNLLDKHYVIYENSSAYVDASVYAPPRSYGVTLEVAFGA